MSITALVPWFGSKRNLAPTIVHELGPHSAYWEPFCGSMAVLLAKPESCHETVNDLHGDLVNLARVIQHPAHGAALYRRLRRTLYTEGQWRESKMLLPSLTDPLERAYHYFVTSWLGRNGLSGTASRNKAGFSVRWTPHEGTGGQRFASVVASIPAWRRRLRRVTIIQRDAFEVLAQIKDATNTVVYVDPPYVEKTTAYLHDLDITDHERLADMLGRFQRARVVVSYYEHPLIHRLYKGWTVRRIEVAKALAHSSCRGTNTTRATELLLINGSSRAVAQTGRLFQ